MNDGFERFENACAEIHDKIEEANVLFEKSIQDLDPALQKHRDIYLEASEAFIVNASKTHANIKKVLETFLREINIRYTTYASTHDTQTVIKDLSDYSLMYGLSGAGHLLSKKKTEIDDLLDRFLKESHKLCTKYEEKMGADDADEARETINDIWDKYYEEFMDMNEDFDEEAKKMQFTQNTIDEVSKEISGFTDYTKHLNDKAVKEIDDLYKMLQSSDNRYFISLCSKVSNQISLFVQKLTVYYVKYPFKVIVVLRKKLRGIKEDEEEKEKDDE